MTHFPNSFHIEVKMVFQMWSPISKKLTVMPVALVCVSYFRSGEQKTHSSPQIPAVFPVFLTQVCLVPTSELH